MLFSLPPEYVSKHFRVIRGGGWCRHREVTLRFSDIFDADSCGVYDPHSHRSPACSAAGSGSERLHMGTDSLTTEHTLSIILTLLIFIQYMAFNFLFDVCTKADTQRCNLLTQMRVSWETRLMSNHSSNINIVYRFLIAVNWSLAC